MENLNSLIPKSIIDQMNLDHVRGSIVFRATAADSRWPKLKVTVNNHQVFDSLIEQEQTVDFSCSCSGIESLNIMIEYYNKTDADTITDSSGNIVENQSVQITAFSLNNIDTVKSQIIYNNCLCHLNLSAAKKQHYQSVGLSIDPSNSLCLYENGHWDIAFPVPVMKYFTKCKTVQAPTELWPNPKLLHDLVDIITEIKILEKQANQLNQKS